MISCFANKRKKKDQIARAKKLNPKRDKTKHGLQECGVYILAFGSLGLMGLRKKSHFW